MATEDLRKLLLHVSKISLHQQVIREAVPPALLFPTPGPTIQQLEDDESSDVATNPNGGRKKKKQTRQKRTKKNRKRI